MSTPIAQVNNVSKIYRDLKALDGVSVTLEK